MKKNIIVLIMLSFCITQSITQNIRPSKDNTMVVISTAGLNLRESPSLKSRNLLLIEYGERVEVKSDSLYGLDTVILKNRKKITGNWKKVSYEGVEGYMFRPYLLSIDRSIFPLKRINRDYGLWYGLGTCFNNLQYDGSLNWYGFGLNEDGESVAELTAPSFYWEKGAIEDYIMLELELDYQPLFLLGSKKKIALLRPGIFNEMDLNNRFDESKEINKQMYYDKESGKLIYCYENREIDLSDKNRRVEGVHWKGDINGDEVDDFVIQYGNKGGKIVFLQSNSSGENIYFERVAEFIIGYCC